MTRRVSIGAACATTRRLIAPGFYTGYAPKSLPGLTEDDWNMAAQSVEAITTAVYSAAQCLSLGICPFTPPLHPVRPIDPREITAEVCAKHALLEQF